MTLVAVVGGHGNVARHLYPMLTAAGHTGVALVRREEYRDELEALGAQVRMLDIETADAEDFAAAFQACGAVVFAAGGGGDGSVERKRTVDLEGSLKSVQGADRAGVRRLVQISAIGVDQPADPDRGESWTAYVEAKRDADAALRDSDLDWTILRPGRLTDDAPTGQVSLGTDLEYGEIPRADVAAVVVACLDDDASVGHQWDLVSGENPVAEAVRLASQG